MRHLVQLPVLLYHHVGPISTDIPRSLTLSPQKFEQQVRWLARWGYCGIRCSDVLAHFLDQTPLPDKPVLLTFDDAYADLVPYALPVLEHYGFGAVIFVVTGLLGATNRWDRPDDPGTGRLMSAEQIRSWATRGIDFGAHSRTHPHLTRLTPHELEDEVKGSASDLANLLTAPTISFAYPYGSHNEQVRNCVQGAFDLAFTLEEGLNDLQTHPHLLRRTMIQHSDTFVDLALRVWLGWSPLHQLRFRLSLRSRFRNLLSGGS